MHRKTRTAAFVSSALAALAVGASTMPATASAAGSDRSARVVKVVDGDSLVLATRAGKRRHDLLGVRAPALGDCFGRQARTRLRTLLPAGTRVRVIARKRGARRVVVLRRGTGVNRLVVASGHALSTLEDGSRLARLLAAAQENAESDGRGLWDACEQREENEDGERAPGADEQESPEQAAPPAQEPGRNTRLSRAQFAAFVENSVFTRVSSSSSFGGSSNRSDFTFCPGGTYRFTSESFNNGLVSNTAEAGRWRLVDLQRLPDAGGDVGQLELVTEESDDSEFDPASPEATRTFPVSITVLDDGRVRVGDDIAERSAATC